MSELLTKLAGFLETRLADPSIHVVSHGSEPLELTPEANDCEHIIPAKIVEGEGDLRPKLVALAGHSHFTHFLDGIQQSHVVFYWSGVPVVYGRTAAVVRDRSHEGLMDTWRTIDEEALYVAEEQLAPEARHELTNVAFPISPVCLPKELPPTLTLMYRITRQAVGERRVKIEQALTQQWQAEFPPSAGAWLLIDGSLLDPALRLSRPNGGPPPNVVGVVKSCKSAYFPLAQQLQLYGLRRDERSPVFAIRAPSGVLTFYQRLFDPNGLDLLHGLIRVEFGHTNGSSGVTEQASTIASWLLLERAPLSRPDPRWHQMVYPIFDCEQFLKAIGPTSLLRRSTLMGLRP